MKFYRFLQQFAWAAGFVLAALACSGCGDALPPHTWFDPSQVVRQPKQQQSPVNPIWDRFGSADQSSERIPGSTLPRPDDLQFSEQDYHIGPSDVLRVSVMDLFAEGQEAVLEKQVSQSGYIDMPLLEHRIRANGLTQDDLAEEIKKAYQPDILRDATVSVAVVGARQNVFSILGAVNRPSTYQITRADFTLLEALAVAGDVSQPNIDWVYVIRAKPRQATKTAEKTPAGEELPPLPPIPSGTPTKPAPAGAGTPPASAPGQEGPSLQEQLKDLERLIPGAKATPRRDPSRPMNGNGKDEPVYMSSIGGSAVDASMLPGASSGEAASAPQPAWRYVNGRWINAAPNQGTTTSAQSESAPSPEEQATSEPDTHEGEDPFGWKKYTYSDTVRIIAINLPELKAGDARLNIMVRSQDIIQIPTLELGYFYVMGEVSRPGVYDLRGQRITLKEAVAAAGNLGQLSWPSNTVLYRRVARDQEQMIPIDLNAIFSGRDPDIFLKPDDVVAVGSNWIAPFMAVWRNAFRLTYGFGFIYDRNYSEQEFEVPVVWPRSDYRNMNH